MRGVWVPLLALEVCRPHRSTGVLTGGHVWVDLIVCRPPRSTGVLLLGLDICRPPRSSGGHSDRSGRYQADVMRGGRRTRRYFDDQERFMMTRARPFLKRRARQLGTFRCIHLIPI